MSLMSKFKKNTTDASKFGARQVNSCMRTGFPTFDYFNGNFSVDVINNTKQLNLGINAGKPILISGPTSSGKSTFAYQLAINMTMPYENSGIIVLDTENAFNDQRFLSMPGMTASWYADNVDVRNGVIYSETLMEIGLELYNMKKEMADELLIDDPNGIIDPVTGNVAKIYTPTVIILDSLAFLLPKDFADTEDAELNGLTMAGRVSLINGQIFKRLIPLFREVNINLITVQHLSTAFSPNGMPKAPVVKGLKTDEHIAGGKAVTYISDTLLVVALKERLEKDKSNNPFKNIEGYMAEFRMLKSRNSPAGRTFNLVYSQVNGFDPIASMFMDLKNGGKLEGSSVYKLPNYDVKFRASNFVELFNSNETFRNAVYEAYNEYGIEQIQVSENMKSLIVNEENINEVIQQQVDDLAQESNVVDDLAKEIQ